MAADAKFDYSRSKCATQPPAGASLSVIVSPAVTVCFVDGQMLGVFAAVVGILPELHFPAATVEEVELHGDLARLAVGHRAEIPVVARLAGHHQVLAHRAVEHARLVPHGGHDLEEVGTGLVAEIVRMIADAVDRAVVADEQRELGGPRALHGRRLGVRL